MNQFYFLVGIVKQLPVSIAYRSDCRDRLI